MQNLVQNLGSIVAPSVHAPSSNFRALRALPGCGYRPVVASCARSTGSSSRRRASLCCNHSTSTSSSPICTAYRISVLRARLLSRTMSWLKIFEAIPRTGKVPADLRVAYTAARYGDSFEVNGDGSARRTRRLPTGEELARTTIDTRDIVSLIATILARSEDLDRPGPMPPADACAHLAIDAGGEHFEWTWALPNGHLAMIAVQLARAFSGPSIAAALKQIIATRLVPPDLIIRYHVRVPPPGGGGEITAELRGTGELIETKRRRTLATKKLLAVIELLVELEAWRERPMRRPPAPDSWYEQLSISIGNETVQIGDFQPTGIVHRIHARMTGR